MSATEVKQRLAEFVTEMFPALRRRMSKVDESVAVHLRGNDKLYAALRDLLTTRLEARSSMGEPRDPNDCKSIVARNSEIQWLLTRLESIYRSPLNQQESGEPPA